MLAPALRTPRKIWVQLFPETVLWVEMGEMKKLRLVHVQNKYVRKIVHFMFKAIKAIYPTNTWAQYM